MLKRAGLSSFLAPSLAAASAGPTPVGGVSSWLLIGVFALLAIGLALLVWSLVVQRRPRAGSKLEDRLPPDYIDLLTTTLSTRIWAVTSLVVALLLFVAHGKVAESERLLGTMVQQIEALEALQDSASARRQAVDRQLKQVDTLTDELETQVKEIRGKTQQLILGHAVNVSAEMQKVLSTLLDSLDRQQQKTVGLIGIVEGTRLQTETLQGGVRKLDGSVREGMKKMETWLATASDRQSAISQSLDEIASTRSLPISEKDADIRVFGRQLLVEVGPIDGPNEWLNSLAIKEKRSGRLLFERAWELPAHKGPEEREFPMDSWYPFPDDPRYAVAVQAIVDNKNDKGGDFLVLGIRFMEGPAAAVEPAE